MAFIQCNCQSQLLGVGVTFWAIVPEPPFAPGKKRKPAAVRFPVLYLLHGLSDDHTMWVRKTSIERYALDAGIAVVMPAVNRSFYADMKHGYPYWAFITEELPYLAQRMLPVSDRPSHTYVAGLSMGGYGAFKMALTFPQRFAAAASLSGALDMAHRTDDAGVDDGLNPDLTLCFGGPECVENTENDLLMLLGRYSKSKGRKPLLYQWCGTEDFLYGHNTVFRKRAKKLGVRLTYEEGPGGHEWVCWDRQIQRFIELVTSRKSR